MTVHGEEDRKTGRSARREARQESWLRTVAALVTVHVVLLVAYGVHSKWHWATQLTDTLAAFASVLRFYYHRQKVEVKVKVNVKVKLAHLI